MWSFWLSGWASGHERPSGAEGPLRTSATKLAMVDFCGEASRKRAADDGFADVLEPRALRHRSKAVKPARPRIASNHAPARGRDLPWVHQDVAGHEAHRRRSPNPASDGVDHGAPGLGRAQVLDLGGCARATAIEVPVRSVRWLCEPKA